MKWRGGRRSSNIEDRRGQSFSGMGGGKGISPFLILPLIRMLFSKKGIFLVGGILIFLWISGTNPLTLLQQFVGGGEPVATTRSYNATPEEENLAEFTAVVLGYTEEVWNELMDGYREPSLVLFSGEVQSACGFASAATGPFYCPGDERVYIDLSFFQDMGKKLGAPGDFAQAYVIAHEVGHHVQKLNGTLQKVQSQRGKIPEREFNQLMVRLELQADFYAGLWAHYAHKNHHIMEEGDLEEALNAASAVGDDRLQKQATGRVVPDSFTHGTSAQRSRWFRKGYETGDVRQGDTFSTNNL